MDKYIKLASTTEAIRARNILYKYGIRSQVKRIPGKNTRYGCTFGIIVLGDFDRALEILEKHNFHINGRAYGDEE